MNTIHIKPPLHCSGIGQREHNEDSLYPRPGDADEHSRLFLVCDGVGGGAQGEIASACVSEAFADYWTSHPDEPEAKEKLYHALDHAVTQLSACADQHGGSDMSTTVTLASISEQSILIAHIGDSRIYHIRPQQGILHRSKDHTYVQGWIDAGIISEEEAKTHPKKNIILQAVIPHPSEYILADITQLTDIQDGDYLLLCTDGILESLDDATLLSTLAQEGSDEDKMQHITQLCQQHSRDNYSAYLIPLTLAPAPALAPVPVPVPDVPPATIAPHTPDDSPAPDDSDKQPAHPPLPPAPESTPSRAMSTQPDSHTDSSLLLLYIPVALLSLIAAGSIMLISKIKQKKPYPPKPIPDSSSQCIHGTRAEHLLRAPESTTHAPQ